MTLSLMEIEQMTKKIIEKLNPNSHVELGSSNNRYWFLDNSNHLREVFLLRDDYTSSSKKFFRVISPKKLNQYLLFGDEFREEYVAKIFAKNILAIYRESYLEVSI
jgi:hypothetical protein